MPFLPMMYNLCNQTVTVHHRSEDGQFTATVFRNAFLDYKKVQNIDKTGSREASSFLLIIPGSTQTVFHGDKVQMGEHPACTTREEWAQMIPSKVPGLVVVQSVDVKYWNGKIVHTEAGG